MRAFNKYEIPFVGLKRGNHLFTYTVNNEFFEQFERSPIVTPAQFEVNLDFEKGNFFMLHFNISGTIQTACDRCAEQFDLPIESEQLLIVKFDDDLIPGEEPTDEDDDVVYISRNDTHFNIANHLYEFIVLSIPMRKVHPDDEDGYPTCEINYQNEEATEEATDEEAVDPRWEALKKIRKN